MSEIKPIFSQAAKDQLAAINKDIKSIYDSILTLNKSKVKLGNSDAYAKNASKTNKVLTEQEIIAKRLIKQTKELSIAKNNQGKVITVLTTKVSLEKKAVRDATKELLIQRDAIDKLKKQLVDAERVYNNLFLTLGKGNKKTMEAKRSFLDLKASLVQLKNSTKEVKQVVNATLSPFEKLKKRLADAKKEALNLAQTLGTGSKAYKDAQAKVHRLDGRINHLNKSMKQNTKIVKTNSSALRSGGVAAKQYGGAFGGIKRSFTNVLGAMGIVGGFYALFRVMKSSLGVIKGFDLSMQTLAGVLRISRDDLSDLESEIKLVGETTIRTSTETAKLAESLATLGKSKDDIKVLLRPITDLSVGLQSSSEEAGEFLVRMLNVFGAGADEASEYADVIATIRTSTSLDFQSMRDSFQYLAPISKLLGEDLAYTGSVIGILADNGLRAQQAGRVLGTSLQKLAKKGLDLEGALSLISKAQKEGVKGTELLALANDLLGAEGAKVGIVLARNTDLIQENAQAIRDNGGALGELVGKQLDSLDGSLKLLISKWEAFILNTAESSNAVNILKSSVDFLTRNLETLVTATAVSIGLFATYKTILLGINVVSAIRIAMLAAHRVAIVVFSRGLRSAIVLMKGFRLAMATTGIGLFVVALTGLIYVLNKAKKTASQLASAANNITQSFLKGAKKAINLNNELEKLVDRYEELIEKQKNLADGATLSTREQKELNEIIKKLAKNVPAAALEFALYGDEADNAAGKVREFIVAQKELLGLNAKADYDEQTKALKALREEKEKVIATTRFSLSDKSFTIDDDSNEYSFKTGVLQKKDLSGNGYMETTAREKSDVANYIEKNKRDIKAAEEGLLDLLDIIATSEGRLTDRQKSVIDLAIDLAAAALLVEEGKLLDAEIKIIRAKIKVLEELKPHYKERTVEESDALIALDKQIMQKEARLKEIRREPDKKGGGRGRGVGSSKDKPKKDDYNFLKEVKKEILLTSDEVVKGVEEDVAAILKSYRDGEIDALQFNKELADLKKNTTEDILDDTLTMLENTLIYEGDNVERRKTLEKLISDYKRKLRAEELKDYKDFAQEEIDEAERVAAEKLRVITQSSEKGIELDKKTSDAKIARKKAEKDILDEIISSSFKVASGLIDRAMDKRIASFDKILERATVASDKEIELGQAQADSGVISQREADAKKAASLEKLAAVERRIRYEQAKADKQKRLFGAIIDTFAAVVSGLVQGGPVLAAANGIIGAANIALIASEPLPAFKTGVRDFEGGMATIGDGGAEILETGGQQFYVPNEITTYLPKGSNVYTNTETKKMMGSDNSISNKWLEQIANKKTRVNINQTFKSSNNTKLEYLKNG